MIKCPNAECGHENVPGTQFCEGCGEELPAAGAAHAAPAGATVKCPACDNENPADNQVCEICGAELPAAHAAHAPAPPPPPPMPSPPAPLAAPVAATPPDVHAAPTAPPPDTTASPFDAPAPSVDAAPAPVVPSFDAPVAPDTTATDAPVVAGPELLPGGVKLTVEQGMSVGAQFVLGDPEVLVGREDEDEGIYPDIDLSDQDAGYVHRRHATLSFRDGQLFVTHLGGANKTRINNRPLPDNEPQPVNLGDKVAFGKVVVRVSPV